MKTYKAKPLIPEIYNKIVSHLSMLQLAHSKILPMRIDFAYKKTSHSFQNHRVDIALEDIQIFMSMVLLRTVAIGYFWVMEYTRDTGYHFHAILYANGQEHQKPYPIAMGVTKLWEEQTGGEGRCYLVKRNASYFHVDGLKMLRHGDINQRNDLLLALRYFAKTEQKEMGLYYGMSSITPPSGRGRPRKG
ncbi:hypothetical protein BS639_22715 [Rouxiella silvae]|uniref:Inovirus Gp2 family protein n=1 Tax=Rouxiella silvae TaxID=1646373 RepID=A0ABX3TUP6_9GAMM|nr:inovirus-type Gp2 protein [Rouxiella silvae]ORJ18939.1 hypothetical protein BS639_22715 [Rouxiella silvae]